VKIRFTSQQIISFLTLAVVTTIPLVFGAVHPIVRGSYVSFILVVCGGYLLFSAGRENSVFPSLWLAIPLLIIGWITLLTIPLPLDWVESLSPTRALRVRMVNELAETVHGFTSLGYTGIAGLYKAMFLLALILYYYTLKQLMIRDKKFFFTLVTCLILVGSFEALYGLLQFVKPQLGMLWLPISGRAAHGTIIYKNQYATLLNMIWPLALASGALYFIKKKALVFTKAQAPLLIAAASLMIFATLFSLSRGGILTMVAVGMLLIALLPFSRKAKLWFFLVFTGLIFGYGALLGLDTILTRFGSIDQSGSIRFNLYLSSLPILFDHWLTGIGIGAYSLLSPIYLEGFPANLFYDRAHNEYLELFIELGIPAASLLFLWAFTGMLKLKREIGQVAQKPGGDLARVVVATAAFCGLIGFLVHGSVEFGWRLPANIFYAVTLVALCTGCAPEASAQME
jgi:O-antigen ligase